MLTIRNLSKKYTSEYALREIDLTIQSGKIHGIIGANGSGKSTLLKILNGDASILDTGGYEGVIEVKGEPVSIRSHHDAIRNGIAMVHQELALLDELSIASNIKLNRENLRTQPLPSGLRLVDEKKNQEEAADTLQRISVSLDPAQSVESLSTNQKQFVEIARGLDNDKLLLLMMDEPTSALNVRETENLLVRLRELADHGLAILFVSHRLDEVVQLCDSVTVFRDGRRISTYDRSEFDIERFTIDMVGENIVKAQKRVGKTSREPLVSFCFQEADEGKKTADLEILRGEILGITGLAGNGKEQYSKSIMGIVPMQGEIRIEGKRLQPGDERNIDRYNLCYLSDDRGRVSLLRESPIWKNMVFGTEKRHKHFLRFPILGGLSALNHEKIKVHAQNLIKDLHIVSTGADQKVGDLSGGNQQKVCIARALTMDADFLLVDEPTRGIDVFSKEVILNLLLQMNEEKNTTVVITSGEVEEMIRVCDRIAVIYENRVFCVLDGEINLEELTMAMFGRSMHEDQ